MARDKQIDMRPTRLTVDFPRQMLPGSLESALGYWIDPERELSEVEPRDRNAEEGAPASAPALVLKIILLAYSRGLVSLRAPESAWRQNVPGMAVCGGARPHVTTRAAFGNPGGEALSQWVTPVVLVCDRQGLMGRQRLALAGVKLPSNASKARSSPHQEFQREAQKRERAVQRIVARHRQETLPPRVSPRCAGAQCAKGSAASQKPQRFGRGWGHLRQIGAAGGVESGSRLGRTTTRPRGRLVRESSTGTRA
jgi:hypothetical protein